MHTLIRLLVALAALFVSVHAHAANCPALPSLITQPCLIAADGSYRLSNSIDGTNVPANANSLKIVIEIAQGVTQAEIDCYNYRIESNDPAWAAFGVGVGGVYNANVVVKNCHFGGSGMLRCVSIDNSGANWAYQNVRLEGNTCNSTSMGFYVLSRGFKSINNYLADIGGHVSCGRSFGILFGGADAEIRQNKIA